VPLSFVPGFKHDLFVSYAHRNDQPWNWVTTLVETLKAAKIASIVAGAVTGPVDPVKTWNPNNVVPIG